MPALDRDRKAFGRFALGTFEGAHIKARRTRFDRGHSHGFAAPEARQYSNFRAAEYWFGMRGWHNASRVESEVPTISATTTADAER